MKERLTSIETLPEEATSDCQWLYDAIKSRRKNQTDMLLEVNRRLGDRGIAAVSRSGLNRYVMKVRSGEARRPELIQAQGTDKPSASVFNADFREILEKKQGFHATALLEAALSALVQS